MKKGTPAGQQLDCAVKAGFVPARISSVSFFMRSFTHGFRFGFDRSGIRKVGWVPKPAALGTKGCAGSLVTGGTRPGTDSKNGPVPLNPTHPTRLDEKSGEAAVCCAAADATSAAPMRPANTTASQTLFVVPAEREARRAGTHTPQPLVSPVAMGPGSALASLAWPGRQNAMRRENFFDAAHSLQDIVAPPIRESRPLRNPASRRPASTPGRS